MSQMHTVLMAGVRAVRAEGCDGISIVKLSEEYTGE